LSFRGRGKSDSPLTGYSLEDHVSDIAAVVRQLELDDFYLMGYSRGVSYALGYAIHHHKNIKGLIIEEYPAQHKQMPSGWGEKYLLSPWGGKMNSQAVMGIEIESRQVDFQDNLANLDCPTLIMRGGNEGSLLSDDDIKCYGRCLRNIRLEVFEDAGHDIQTEYFDRFVKVINAFLIELG
jgi:pimeloyl-ACP methyl ester carboxylesterase